MKYLLTVLLVALPGTAYPLNLSGRLTASLNSWERQNTDSTSAAHNTMHQLFSLQAKDIGVKGLSFHAYGRGFVYVEASESRRRLALYSTYVDWKRIARRLDLRIGRQIIFAGVGRGTIDGAQAGVTLPYSVSLLAYAGIGAPDDRSTRVGGWSEANMYGIRASTRRWKSTFSLSFASESRSRRENTLDGPTGTPVKLSTLARRLIGAEVRTQYLTKSDLYGRIELDAEDWRVTRIQARARRQASPKLRLSGELDHRWPALDRNSYLRVFTSKANSELEAAAAYALRVGYDLTVAYGVVFLAHDETHKFRLGLSLGQSTISYYRRMGYGGDRDGLSLASRRAIISPISLRASLNFSSYKLKDTEGDRHDTMAGVLGLDYSGTRKLAASIEGQVLRNRTDDLNLRLFAKVTWWFNLKT